MGILKDWRDHAYGLDDKTPEGKQFWLNYFQVEKGIYEDILKRPDEIISCSVKELAEKYDTTLELITGFLDGIDDSLVKSNNLDEADENTVITIAIDKEKLYMNMVSCNAEWLYTLPEWDEIFTKEQQAALYKKEKSSHTIVKAPKVGRKDPCPCGSGKKYKKCCGA